MRARRSHKGRRAEREFVIKSLQQVDQHGVALKSSGVIDGKIRETPIRRIFRISKTSLSNSNAGLLATLNIWLSCSIRFLQVSEVSEIS